MKDYLIALLLGIVEGLTEFIPVSSTAHLVVLGEWLSFRAPPGHVFEVCIQLGAIMAVIVVYWKKLWGTLVGIGHDRTAQSFAANVIVATIPALIIGALARDWIKGVLYDQIVIAVALIIGGIIILLFEKKLTNPKIETVDHIPLKTAFLIGCCQSVALIPGVSRSGATIIGALGCGLSRRAAVEFSFFMAIPVMFAAVGYDLYRGWNDIMAHDYLLIMLTGLVAAFLSALLVIKIALQIIERYGFTPFAWYRIGAGIFILILTLS